MDFGLLAVVMAAGLLGPLLASVHRFAPPVVVGQIAAGVVMGTSGLGWIKPDDPFVSGLATIGFALLMFIVGTHMPLRDVGLRSAVAAGAGVAATVGILAAAAGLVISAHVGLPRPGILAVLIATSSGAVALPVLQALTTRNRVTLVTTAWIAIADVGTVLTLPLVLATGRLGRVLVGGALVIAAAIGLYLVARALRGTAVVLQTRSLSRDRGWGLDLRISLLALFACAWLATRFGTSILIAGFAVGAVVALLGAPRRVAQQLVGVGEGFLIPVFFVHLGSQLDLGALVKSRQALWLATAIAAIAIVVHVVAALAWRLTLGVGLLASAQLGVPAAVVSIGLTTHQLTAAQGSAIMAALLATLAASAAGSVLLGHGGSLSDANAPTAPVPLA